MDYRQRLFLLTLFVIASVSLAVLWFSSREGVEYRPGVSVEYDRAVQLALNVFDEKKALGVNFENGPCLTNDLMPDWVADIAHNPRQKIDDLAENQCQAFREGRAKHFVELDKNGEVIRVF